MAFDLKGLQAMLQSQDTLICGARINGLVETEPQYWPGWFSDCMRQSSRSDRVLVLADIFPQLTSFMARVRQYLHQPREDRLCSEPWSVTMLGGMPLKLQCRAGFVSGQLVLFIAPTGDQDVPAGEAGMEKKRPLEGQGGPWRHFLQALVTLQWHYLVADAKGMVGAHNLRADTQSGAPQPIASYLPPQAIAPLSAAMASLNRARANGQTVSWPSGEGGPALESSAYLMPWQHEAILIILPRQNSSHQMETQIQELLSMTNHEIRTPLAGISGSLDMLVEDFAQYLPEAGMEWVAIARDSTKRTIQLLEKFLTVQRIEWGQHPFRPEAINLGTLISRVVRECQSQAAHHSVPLVMNEPEGDVWLQGDATTLSLLAAQFIGNALKVSLDKYPVSVVVGHNNGHARLEVRDRGVGIPGKYAKKLFEKFARFPQKGIAKGTGLGLALAKVIAQKHGGSVGHLSNSEGETVFFAEFPGIENPAG